MRSILISLVITALLAACVTVKPPVKVHRGGGWYTVKRSDTLYSIAWRYGLDYKELARWNQIDVNEPIHPGQQLRLVKPRQATTTATAPKPQTKPAKAKPKSKAVVADNTRYRDPKKWLWPTKGKLLNTFLASDLDRRGIDIAGKLGQPVIAVADGKVVYSGNGLAGYGNLIIIKHSDTYLSAYAYCQERLVREGTAVKAGKVVAKMGRWDGTAKLYFEIRRNGKPVDPMKYLPDR